MDDGNLDVQLISTDDIEVIQAHVQAAGAPFGNIEVTCDMNLRFQADDSSNGHRVFYVPMAAMRAGTIEADRASLLMGRGADNTNILNRADGCDCCDSEVNACLQIGGERSCTSIWCSGGNVVSLADPSLPDPGHTCGQGGKPRHNSAIDNVIYTRLEFRPRSGDAYNNQWHRNAYTLSGQQCEHPQVV